MAAREGEFFEDEYDGTDTYIEAALIPPSISSDVATTIRLP